MKMIKTVRERVQDVEKFDNQVNAALADGYTLKKRTLVVPNCQHPTKYTDKMLYAELEKNTKE